MNQLNDIDLEKISKKCLLILKANKVHHYVTYNKKLRIIKYPLEYLKIDIIYTPSNSDSKKVFSRYKDGYFIDYHKANTRWMDILNHEVYKTCGKDNITNLTSS